MCIMTHPPPSFPNETVCQLLYPFITVLLIVKREIEIKLNALYDRRLLNDYGGTLFDQHQAKLVQRNITDATGALIPPWEEYDNLRTGSVVLARVSLKLYCIQTGSKTRKVSHLLFRRLLTSLMHFRPALSNLCGPDDDCLTFR